MGTNMLTRLKNVALRDSADPKYTNGHASNSRRPRSADNIRTTESSTAPRTDRDINAVVRKPGKDAEPQRRDSESQLKRPSSCTDMRHIDVHPTPDPSPMENPTNDTAQKASVERDAGSGENSTSTNPPVASKSSKDCIQYSEIVANRPRKDSKMKEMPSRQASGRHAGLEGEEVDENWRKKYLRKKKELEMVKQAALHDSAKLKEHNARLHEELLSLQAQLDRLQNAHVKAVNSSGAGLDPISDQAFISKLNNLHAEVNSYCRRVFKRVEIEIRDEKIDCWVKKEHRCRRRLDSYGFTVGNILEVILWSWWEARYNSSWFFWDIRKSFAPTETTEMYVRNGDNSAGKERSEFWRSYTASLIIQSQGCQKYRSEAVHNLACDFIQMLQNITQRQLSHQDQSAFYELVLSFSSLCTELRCQRPYYCFDARVKAGMKFNHELMEDFKDVLDEDGDWVVAAVVTRGLVRKQHRDAVEVQKVLVKARVILERSEPSLLL